MFKISPIQDKALQEKMLSACGAEARPGFFAYSMVDLDSGKLMGTSQFEIRGKEGFISDIKSVPELSDFEAMFILGRQTMNFIDSCGAHICRAAKNAAEDGFLIKLGFKPDGDEYFADMTGMFDGSHCSGGHPKH